MSFAAAVPPTTAVVAEDQKEQPFHASAIAAGTKHSYRQVTEAEREVNDRKHARYVRPGLVTEAQIHASKKRKTAIEFSHAYETYGNVMTGAPVTLAQMTTALGDLSTQMTTALAQTTTAMGDLSTKITATINAESTRRYNSSTITSDTARLRRIPKTVPNDAPPGGGVPDANVGDRCPMNIFPATKTELKSMNQQAIDDLRAWYNQDFGINEGESIEEQREKVLEFVYWG